MKRSKFGEAPARANAATQRHTTSATPKLIDSKALRQSEAEAAGEFIRRMRDHERYCNRQR